VTGNETRRLKKRNRKPSAKRSKLRSKSSVKRTEAPSEGCAPHSFRALGVSHVIMEASYRDPDHMISTFETFAREIRPRV